MSLLTFIFYYNIFIDVFIKEINVYGINIYLFIIDTC